MARGPVQLRRLKAGPGPNSPGAEKSQPCRKYFLQYSTFASERPEVRTLGHQSCFLPQAPSNLGTPQSTFADLKRYVKNSNRRENIFMYYLFPNTYTYLIQYFQKIIM